MKNDPPIIKWRTRVRRFHRQGKSVQEIAAALRCSPDLVDIQIRVWDAKNDKKPSKQAKNTHSR